MPSITQTEFKAIINGMVHGKVDQLVDSQVTMNRAVRFVLGDMNLRSAKRTSQLAPNLFAGSYDYAAPTDLKDTKVIDLIKQVNRASSDFFVKVDETDFDRTKGRGRRMFAVADASFSRILKVDGATGFTQISINSCDSLTANGTAAVVAGTDASNLTLDQNNYVSGSGSLNFDMAAGAATGAIEITDFTDVDLSDYDEQGAFFMWVYIPDYADAQGDTVTNFILRWGNDSSNYWSRTVTVNNEGQTFHDGWNLLRFDWDGSATETGTVAPAAIDYIRLTVTKSTSLAADTDWRLDNIVFRVGEIYNVLYYTKHGWQDTNGTYIEESTTTTDVLNADTEEVEILATKAAQFASDELRDDKDADKRKMEYKEMKANYGGQNEAPITTTSYV